MKQSLVEDIVYTIDPNLNSPQLLKSCKCWDTFLVNSNGRPAVLKASKGGVPYIEIELSRLVDAADSGVVPDLLDIYPMGGDNLAFLRTYESGDVLRRDHVYNRHVFGLLLDTVDKLHERGVVGLDMRLPNFVVNDGVVKMIDLGLPCRKDCSEEEDSQSDVDKAYGFLI